MKSPCREHDLVEHRIGAGLLRRTCRHCDLLEIDRTAEPFLFAGGLDIREVRASLRRRPADEPA